MPLAQFHDPINNRNIVRGFATPKRLDRPIDWLREIRKVIPEVPDLRKSDWYVGEFDATLSIIKITLFNSVGERCYIAIDRKRSVLAA